MIASIFILSGALVALGIYVMYLQSKLTALESVLLGIATGEIKVRHIGLEKEEEEKADE